MPWLSSIETLEEASMATEMRSEIKRVEGLGIGERYGAIFPWRKKVSREERKSRGHGLMDPVFL